MFVPPTTSWDESLKICRYSRRQVIEDTACLHSLFIFHLKRERLRNRNMTDMRRCRIGGNIPLTGMKRSVRWLCLFLK